MVKVISTEPMSLEEIVDYTGRDAFANICGYPCRIMSVSPGQTIEVDKVVREFDTNRTWGLRRIPEGKTYQYTAFLCSL